MRVALISTTFRMVGGSETYLDGLTRALLAGGHQVLQVGNGHADPLPPGVEVLDIPDLEGFRVVAANAARVVREVRRFGADVVHIHNQGNDLLARRLTRDLAPVVRTLHGHGTSCPIRSRFLAATGENCRDACGWVCFSRGCVGIRDPRGLVLFAGTRFLDRGILDASHRVVVASEYTRRTMAGVGYRTDHFRVIPYLVEPPALPLAPAPADGPVLFVGRLVQEKGYVPFLEAMARLGSDARARVVGDGAERAAAEGLARDLGIADRVEFCGWLLGEDLTRAYDAARVVAFPSLWNEPFGLIGPEAGLRGRPVVGFDVGGVAEWLVDGETGVLVPRGDVDRLAAGIGDLLADPARARAMGEAGRARALARHDPGAHLEALLEVYRE